MTVTLGMLRKATFTVQGTITLDKGGWCIQSRCDQFPRLAVMKKKLTERDPVITTYTVDDKVCIDGTAIIAALSFTKAPARVA